MVFHICTHYVRYISPIISFYIEKYLNEGYIVIVAGFQGVDENGNITTFGRGGSDTTAVALASSLKADRCDIFTDVDGVYTSDPRIVEKVKKLKKFLMMKCLSFLVWEQKFCIIDV